MDLQKLAVKIFVEQPNTIPLTDFIDVFHRWIQRTDGAYHDVADYSHMHAGPGIVLIANDANVSMDESGNRRGLLFSQKGPLAGSNREKLRHVLRGVIANCRKLEAERSFDGKLRFDRSEFEISVNDRAVAVNSGAASRALEVDVAPIAREIFGDAQIGFARHRDPRRRLSLCVKASQPVSSWAPVGLGGRTDSVVG